MPDICDLILDDHEVFRRRFGELDELHRADAAPERSASLWTSLADLLEVHASAEEAVFYPHLLREGGDGTGETTDAIKDHNEIRDAIRLASGQTPGSDGWWDTVASARSANSDHIAEEERGAIADFRVSASEDEREQLGLRWLHFQTDHAGRRGIDTSDKDVDRYVAHNR